jgi:hypothetical protein
MSPEELVGVVGVAVAPRGRVAVGCAAAVGDGALVGLAIGSDVAVDAVVAVDSGADVGLGGTGVFATGAGVAVMMIGVWVGSSSSRPGKQALKISPKMTAQSGRRRISIVPVN